MICKTLMTTGLHKYICYVCAWRHKYEWGIVLDLKAQLISWRYKTRYKVKQQTKQNKAKTQCKKKILG